MNRRTFSPIFLSLTFLLSLAAAPLVAQPIDFGKMAEEKEREELSTLLTETRTLWQGEAEQLQFETGVLDDELLVLSATNRRLRFSVGNEFDPLEGDYSQRIPGKILFLDLHSLPNRPEIALSTVTFLTGQELKTNVFMIRLNEGEPEVTSFHEATWKLLRPVGNRMMSQVFDPGELWQNEIHLLRTTQSGYSRDEPVSLPEGSRLMSVTRLDEQRRVSINGEGDLVLSRNDEVLSTVEGDFGATSHVLEPLRGNWRRTDKQEPVRLAPEHVEGEELIVVMVNPPVRTGLQGFFSQGNSPSTIKFFSFRGNELTEQSLLGPYEGRVLDLEVSPANPDQLLWTRRTPNGRVLLEMLDMSRL